MSATIETHLSTQEREKLIGRLRDFGEQQRQSGLIADRGSLDRAADLMRLYEDKAWMDELPAAGRRSKVPPDDFRRFTKWAVEDERLGLKRDRITALQRADEIKCNLASRHVELQGATEKVLRPLRWMTNSGYVDRMDEVWKDARQLADGDSPSETEIKRALSDWKRRNVPKVEKGTKAAQVKGNRAKIAKLRTEAERLLYEVPQLAAPVLRELLENYETRRASLPPLEEW